MQEQETDPRTVAEAYLQAFDGKDLARCLDFYDADATLFFGPGGVFRGKTSIEQWHKDRFAADFRLLSVGEIEVNGDTVTIQGVATSRKLRAFKINTLGGKGTFVIRAGKIAKAQFEGRLGASTSIEWRKM